MTFKNRKGPDESVNQSIMVWRCCCEWFQTCELCVCETCLSGVLKYFIPIPDRGSPILYLTVLDVVQPHQTRPPHAVNVSTVLAAVRSYMHYTFIILFYLFKI